MARSAVMTGLKKMQERLKSQDFITPPAGKLLRDWSEDFKRFAIQRAPTAVHQSIAKSIMNAQDTKKFPLWARVFADNQIARWNNYGTGILSTDPLSAKQRYFPSPEGLAEWADLKGRDPWAVAVEIYKKGGTQGSHFFELAAQDANNSMNERFSRFAVGVQREAARR